MNRFTQVFDTNFGKRKRCRLPMKIDSEKVLDLSRENVDGCSSCKPRYKRIGQKKGDKTHVAHSHNDLKSSLI